MKLHQYSTQKLKKKFGEGRVSLEFQCTTVVGKIFFLGGDRVPNEFLYSFNTFIAHLRTRDEFFLCRRLFIGDLTAFAIPIVKWLETKI